MGEVKKQGMESLFCPYEQALALKALGFDEPCVYYVDKNNNSYIYNFQTHPDEFIEWCGVNVIPTPTFSQCFRWFREKYNLYSPITDNGLGQYDFSIKHEWCGRVYDTYEEAELACLKKLLEIVESKSE